MCRTNPVQGIQDEIGEHQKAIAELRQQGARVLADHKASGHDLMRWLTGYGLSDTAARQMCVDIMHERRAARAAAAQKAEVA